MAVTAHFLELSYPPLVASMLVAASIGLVVGALTVIPFVGTAVGVLQCAPCVCDVDDNGSVSISDALVVTALTRCDIRLTASHDGKPSITLAPAASLRERVSALWGAGYAARYVDVDDVRLQGDLKPGAPIPADRVAATAKHFLADGGKMWPQVAAARTPTWARPRPIRSTATPICS